MLPGSGARTGKEAPPSRRHSQTLTNLTGSPASFDVAVGAAGGGIAYSVSTPSVALDAGGSGTVTITMAADRGAAAGGHQDLLTVSKVASEAAHAAVFTLVK